MSNIKDAVKICKRVNNTKRKYLVMNELQCKHYPSSPSKAIGMFDDLARKLYMYMNTKSLVVGFAETATAIGAEVASFLHCDYVNTTREKFDAEFIEFTESHSHATEQKLVKFDFDRYDRVIFVEDEVTTGNTILGIVDKLQSIKPTFEFTVASILNGMSDDNFEEYNKRDIDVYYLLKLDNSNYSDIADSINENGVIINTVCYSHNYGTITTKCLNTRKIVDSTEYKLCLDKLCDSIKVDKDSNVLVIGTEECMYPAIYVGAYLEETRNCTVKCHSTTRSPIAVSNDEGYPLNCCYNLPSCYEDNRRTFIYNLAEYDKVFIITDGNCLNGINVLVDSLSYVGNKNITLVNLEEEI